MGWGWPRSDKWKERLQSTTFEVVVAATLCLNVLWMAVELQIYGSMAGFSLGLIASPLVEEQDKAHIDAVFMLGDVLFTAFFALDVGVRMCLLKLEFWKVHGVFSCEPWLKLFVTKG